MGSETITFNLDGKEQSVISYSPPITWNCSEANWTEVDQSPVYATEVKFQVTMMVTVTGNQFGGRDPQIVGKYPQLIQFSSFNSTGVSINVGAMSFFRSYPPNTGTVGWRTTGLQEAFRSGIITRINGTTANSAYGSSLQNYGSAGFEFVESAGTISAEVTGILVEGEPLELTKNFTVSDESGQLFIAPVDNCPEEVIKQNSGQCPPETDCQCDHGSHICCFKQSADKKSFNLIKVVKK